jgi:hypothetical protein
MMMLQPYLFQSLNDTDFLCITIHNMSATVSGEGNSTATGETKPAMNIGGPTPGTILPDGLVMIGAEDMPEGTLIVKG